MDISILEKPRPTLRQKYDRGPTEKSLGEGTFGRVTKGFVVNKAEAGGNVNVAIKEFKNDGMLSIDRCREISLLKDLSHPNVVKLRDIILEYTENKKYIYSLIFEYADFDLMTLIKNQKEGLKYLKHLESLNNPHNNPHINSNVNTPNVRWLTAAVYKSFLFQLLNGIHYLHSNWIIHRDLKPANILVVDNPEIERGTIKIADFGLARIFKSPLRPLSDNGVVVTIWYRAPELLLGSKHYTRAVDIWAIGCIFAEMILLSPLFPEQESSSPRAFQAKQIEKVFSILGSLTPDKWNDVVWTPEYSKIKDLPTQSNKLAHVISTTKDQGKFKSRECITPLGFELLCAMLDYNPNRRITALQALEHKYFKEDPLPLNNPLLYVAREQLMNLKNNY